MAVVLSYLGIGLVFGNDVLTHTRFAARDKFERRARGTTPRRGATVMEDPFFRVDAASLDPTKVRDALAAIDVMTYYGKVKFDSRGVNIYKPMAAEQYQPDGNKYTVWPADVAEKPPLYPMPAWDKR